ncbi:MAG: hypothetical protein ACPGGK_15640 [Pikeienuella sp.]
MPGNSIATQPEDGVDNCYPGLEMDDWGQLRPVLSGREFGDSYKPETGPTGPILTLPEIIERTTYLATVEHPLAVRYLYAFYSVDTLWAEPDKDELNRPFDWRV